VLIADVQDPKPAPDAPAAAAAPAPAAPKKRWIDWRVLGGLAVVVAIAAGAAVYLFLPANDAAWKNCTSKEARKPEDRIHDCGEVILSAALPKASLAQAHRIRARAFFDVGEAASAVVDYDAAIAVIANDAGLLSERGFALLRNGQPAKAVEDFSAAIGMNPSQLEPVVGRGNALLALGQAELAVQDFSTAISLKPDFAEAYYRRAQASARMSRVADADADYDKAIELSPGNYKYLNARCWFRATMSIDLDLALADCEAALKLKPHFPPALDSRAFVLLRLGRLDAALAAYDETLSHETRYAWPYFGRGLVKKRMGDAVGAQADFDHAVQMQENIAEEYAKYGETP
jgi:tetratricopeptide (TPR) repeat protein